MSYKIIKKDLLIIGSYSKGYQRNKVMLNAFNGLFNISEINIIKGGVKKYLFFLKEVFLNCKNKDYIFLMNELSYRPVFFLFFVKFFFRKKIIFDCFVSIYDTYIYDRKLVKKYSFKSLYYYLSDYFACQLADIIIFDTFEHKKYFVKLFKIRKSQDKIVLPVSLDIEHIDNIKTDNNFYDNLGEKKFNILFYGYYIPLQGVKYIAEAAKILKKNSNLRFILIGSGQQKKEIEEFCKKFNLNNLIFISRIDYKDLIARIKGADACLGIFGNTDKAKRVIPNKVLDCMACNKIVITGRNKEMERYFKDKQDIVFCNMADSKDLAKKVEFVYNNYKDLKYIEKNAVEKIKKNFSKESLGYLIKESIKI
ncbi:glycosyltransferase [Candidatus Parcubacteria bacterium]|nr:glycosyltransferase [Candidatus Parcubacteria bacterium]